MKLSPSTKAAIETHLMKHRERMKRGVKMPKGRKKMNFPTSPEILSPGLEWRDWIRKQPVEKYDSMRAAVCLEKVKWSGSIKVKLEEIEYLIRDEMVSEFQKLVSRVTYLEGALFLAQREAKLAGEVA